jgi:DNA-binding IclR family transcriptional regulator
VHCSALGKALIIDLPDEQVKRILRLRGMPALSPNTITEPHVLLSELVKTREQGYAIDNQEGAVGFCCLGVPIRNRANRIVAAISVSAASPQMTPNTIPTIARDLQATARDISKQLGWSEQSA